MASETASEIEVRRRRAVYRAAHRGTREMDWLLGRYVEARVVGLGPGEMDRIEALLALPDPDLHAWILDPARAGASELRDLVDDIRRFHGIAGGA